MTCQYAIDYQVKPAYEIAEKKKNYKKLKMLIWGDNGDKNLITRKIKARMVEGPARYLMFET